MNFSANVPAFISRMLAANPAVKLQGHEPIRRDERDDEEGGPMPYEMQMSSGGGGGRPGGIPEGKERPDREDEAPQVANADEYSSEDLSHLIPSFKPKSTETDAPAATTSAAAAAAAAGPSAAAAAGTPATAAPMVLSLEDARLLGTKRARADDAAADELEKATGKHIFRRALQHSTPDADQANVGLTPEEVARKKKRKKEEIKKAKSMLTFDEQDI